MLQSEQAIIRCTAAGEQKQVHDDAEVLLKERHHSRGLGQPSGMNCTPKTLTRLSRAIPMAVYRDWKRPAPMFPALFCSGLSGGHVLHHLQQPIGTATIRFLALL